MASPNETSAPGSAVCYRHPDRETLLSCSSCERPICVSCMQQAAVGVRCPECARGGGGGGGVGGRLRRTGAARGPRPDQALVTGGIIAVTLVVFLGQLAQGAGVGGGATASEIVRQGALFGPAVADGEWYRLVTAAFLHGGLVHVGFNMYLLWLLGGALERFAGWRRMATVYAVAVLMGSAGALLLSPNSFTVGASGGVFGLMAAVYLLERTKGIALLGGGIGLLLLLNLGLTFIIPIISIGGHVGGLLGGAAAAWVLSDFGRGHLAHGRITPVVLAALLGLVVAAFAISAYAVL